MCLLKYATPTCQDSCANVYLLKAIVMAANDHRLPIKINKIYDKYLITLEI